jgi:4-hydroxy-tetrahydrodipicolinate reductase
MNLLILGRGKTGSLVASIARQRGHSVRVLSRDENPNASALTAELLSATDAIIDFTTPEAALQNIRAALIHGARIVVGTTGWYSHLPELTALATQHNGALLYGTNFSIGVMRLFKMTAELAQLSDYNFHITETHHTTKLDAPSGTALTLKEIIQERLPHAVVEITSHRIGDAKGEHVVTAKGSADTLELRHTAHSREGFALGALRAAEWIANKSGNKSGSWEFREIFDQL